MERALIEKKHPREKCGKPRPLISVLRACAGGQEPRDCCVCSTAEVGSAGAETLKTHSAAVGNDEEQSVSQRGEDDRDCVISLERRQDHLFFHKQPATRLIP